MKKLYKEQLLKHIQPFLDDSELVKSIDTKKIHEFKIGKSYFYEIVDYQELLKFHDWLNEYFLEKIEINNASKAFISEKSYLHFFEPHRNNYHFLRLDIKSFFHSINIEDIKKVFAIYFEDTTIGKNKKQSLLNVFLRLITYKIPESSANEEFKNKRVLPMGFKTSPKISNIVFRTLDIQIQKICLKYNIIYTRYADDMLFSSNKELTYIHTNNFIHEISFILNQMNFKLNTKKTLKAIHTISLNGYTIDSSRKEFRLSNKKLYKIKKLIHKINIEKKSSSEILKNLFPQDFKRYKSKHHDDQLLNKIKGYRSYLLSFIQFNKKYDCLSDETKNKYIDIVNEMEKLI
jgi:hypothetical protein